MIRSPAAAALALLLAACATAPVAPDPTVDLTGRWTIAAVNGEPTGGGRRFNLEVQPPTGSAQFGCNAGGGSLAISNGWLVAGDPWIFTVAGCPNPSTWMELERKGIQILAKPLAIERSADGIRLRNEVGSIDLIPAPPVSATEIAGTWNVVAINDVPTPGGPSFQVSFTNRQFDGYFGCNRYSGNYTLENGRFGPLLGRRTEKGCELLDPQTRRPIGPVSLMRFEEWAFAILDSRPEVVLRPGGRISLVSPRGRIDLSRAY